MYLFKRAIGNQVLCIYISEELYVKDQTFFSSAFRTFKKTNVSKIVEDTAIYFGVENGETSKCCSQEINCDIKNDQWRYWFLYELENWIITCLNCTVLHCSSVILNNKNVLIMGKSMSGKTTLTYCLCQRNETKYLDDDCIYFYQGMFYGFNFPIAFRESVEDGGGSKVIAYTDDAVMKNRCLVEMKNVTSFFESLDYILFPQFNVDGKSGIRKITGSQLYSKIINNVRWAKSLGTLHNDISMWLKTVESYEIYYTDSKNAMVCLKSIGII